MLTYQNVLEIYSRNYGTTQYFKRPYNNNLFYTDGVMDFQRSLDAYWVVDNIISHIPQILKRFNSHKSDFYVIEICLNNEHSGYIEVYTEDYDKDGVYDEHITIIKQELPLIDLPINEDEELTSYKMYLQIQNYEQMQFILMLTSEY